MVRLSELVEIREMRNEDVPRVMEIERECFATPWHESAYYTEIANRSAYYIVSCVDSEVVGYAGMWVIMDEAHITTLGVARSHRGMRIGEQLLAGLVDEAMRRRARRATLEVRQSNEVAQGLYRKYGFVPAAVRRGYYTDNHENAVVMWIDNMCCAAFINKYRVLKQRLAEETSKLPSEGVV
jgi:ribosomal-protein-alanine N-acetyltransferase